MPPALPQDAPAAYGNTWDEASQYQMTPAPTYDTSAWDSTQYDYSTDPQWAAAVAQQPEASAVTEVSAAVPTSQQNYDSTAYQQQSAEDVDTSIYYQNGYFWDGQAWIPDPRYAQ